MWLINVVEIMCGGFKLENYGILFDSGFFWLGWVYFKLMIKRIV